MQLNTFFVEILEVSERLHLSSHRKDNQLTVKYKKSVSVINFFVKLQHEVENLKPIKILLTFPTRMTTSY
jgi:hypothetical protein